MLWIVYLHPLLELIQPLQSKAIWYIKITIYCAQMRTYLTLKNLTYFEEPSIIFMTLLNENILLLVKKFPYGVARSTILGLSSWLIGKCLTGRTALPSVPIPRQRIRNSSVRRLYEQRKLANAYLKIEILLYIHIRGINETMCLGSRLITSHSKTLYYSGNNYPQLRNGVGIILDADTTKAISNFISLSDRCMLIQITAKPIHINLIQVYTRTADNSVDELEKLYKLNDVH